MNHLTSIHDLGQDGVQTILDLATTLDGVRNDDLAGRIVCSAFFEPSTRTRLSFEAAAHRLGADCIGFSDAAGTSHAKGETLEDAIQVICGYADAIVLRHPEEGAASRAAAVSSVPVINAGDGAGEHPTQTLLDLYTIKKELGDLAVKVGLVGDLKHGRTVHSLVPALQWSGAEVVQVPAWGLELPDGDVPHTGLAEAAATCDVLYVTRLQKERFSDDDAKKIEGALVVDQELLQANDSKAIVMHPLPRVDELSTDVDALPAAKYFDQAHNGVPVRMAVLKTLLEAGA